MPLHSPPARRAGPALKIELPDRMQATSESVSNKGPLAEPQSLDTPSHIPTLGERLMDVAKRKKLVVYEYEKLREGEVRILIVAPAKDQRSDVIASIQALTFEELNADIPYEALSYHWGEGAPVHPVFIESDYNNMPKDLKISKAADLALLLHKKRIFVKPNLYKALRSLRHEERPIALWVDAICIDQASDREKMEQVPRIASVYRHAGRVCIWLGSADFRTDQAMDFVLEIVKASDVQELICSDKVEFWNDMVYLMRKSWFSRRWVIQELALAKEAIVRCGEKEANWSDFADAIGMFNLHFEQIRQLFKESKNIPKEDYNTITDLNPLGAKILVDEISNAFLKGADGRLFEPLKGLESLITTLATFDTSDPRDTVHALLNIAKETSPFAVANHENENNPLPKPSYHKTLLEVYTEFVKWVVFHSGSLDILCRAWALPTRREIAPDTFERQDKLPSWIKVVPESAHGKQTEGHNGRRNGDSFVGVPGARYYNASHGLPAQNIHFGMSRNNASSSNQSTSPGTRSRQTGKRKRGADSDTARKRPNKSGYLTAKHSFNAQLPLPIPEYMLEEFDENRSITVSGFVLNTITWRTDPVADGVIPQRGIEKLGWKRGNGETFNKVDERVWRTLVADRGLDGKNPPSWYHRACLRCLVKHSPNGHINTQSLLDSPQNHPKMLEDFLKRVQAVTWNRVVLEADNNGGLDPLMGIGPPKTEIGDEVCILFGCSVPCILRPRVVGERKYYAFIGEAFIYGKMDGQAVASLSKEQLEMKTQAFQLF